MHPKERERERKEEREKERNSDFYNGRVINC